MEMKKLCYGQYKNSEEADSALATIEKHKEIFGIRTTCPLSGLQCLSSCLFYRCVSNAESADRISWNIYPAYCTNPMFSDEKGFSQAIDEHAGLADLQREIDSHANSNPDIEELFNRFIVECCDVKKKARVDFSTLYSAYCQWVTSQNITASINSKQFKMIVGSSFSFIKKDKIYIKGLRLKTVNNGKQAKYPENTH